MEEAGCIFDEGDERKRTNEGEELPHGGEFQIIEELDNKR